MNYQEAVDYIFSVPKFTKKNEPEHTAELLERLGRPERAMKVIHVAGSNGKGSVCAFLSSILTKAGKHTGLFTSPHLVKINERFQIDQQPVSDQEFLAAYEEVARVVAAMQREGFAHPTYFELLFAVAMILFQSHQVEYAVLETGLGGRLDATNLVEKPVLTVLTSIGLEHTEILGETIEEIAAEKAGIIKAGVPVIYDGADRRAENVIRRRAEELAAPMFPLYDSMYEILRNSDKNIDFLIDCGYDERTEITVPFPAEYQVRNSALALMAIDVLDRSREISLAVRQAGISEGVWQGRMETVMDGVIFDGAHNAQGISEFVRTVRRIGTGRRIVLLFTAVAEKDYDKMIQMICEGAEPDLVITTEIANDRRVAAESLAAAFCKHGCRDCRAAADIRTAFETALAERGDGILFCAGSLYLIGELKGIVKEMCQ